MSFSPTPISSINVAAAVSAFTVFNHAVYSYKISEAPILSDPQFITLSKNAMLNIGANIRDLMNNPEVVDMINVKQNHYSGSNVYTTTINPADLFIYYPLQRAPNTAALLEGLVNYNHDAVSQVVVIEDIRTGIRYIINGQHTAIRAYLLNNPVSIRVIVLDSQAPNFMSVAANLFKTLNTATPVSIATRNNVNITHQPTGAAANAFAILQHLSISTNIKRMVPNGHWHFGRKSSVDKIIDDFGSQLLFDSLGFYTEAFKQYRNPNGVTSIDSFILGSVAIFIYALESNNIAVDYAVLEKVIFNGKNPASFSKNAIINDLNLRMRNSQSVLDAYSNFVNGSWVLDQNTLGDFTGNAFTWRAIGLFDLYIAALPHKSKPVNSKGNVIAFDEVFAMQKPRKHRKSAASIISKPLVPVNTSL